MVGVSYTTTNGGTVGIILVVYIAFLILFLIANVKIITKAGYSGWWILIMFVPLVNLIMYLVFAFSEWPILRNRGIGQVAAPSGPPAVPPAPSQY